MSPRRRAPRPPDVRIHLLDAALRVFARHGYDRATVRQIAEEADVAPGLLYHYFPSKEAVLLALFERSAEMIDAAFAHAAAVADPRARLSALLRVSAQLVREHEDFWRVSYGVRFQHAVLAGLAAPAAAQAVKLGGLFATLLAEIGRPSPKVDAVLLFASLDGVFQHYVLDPQGYPLDQAIEGLIVQYGGDPSMPPQPPTPA